MNDVSLLKQSVLPRLPEMVTLLLPDRPMQCSSREIRVGNRGSLCIDRASGVFCNHESGEGGDLISFVQHARGGSFRDAVDWLDSFMGMTRSSISQSIAPLNHHKARNEAKRLKKARTLWRQSQPMADTLAEHYLRHHRHLRLETCPSDLRYLANCYHPYAKQSFPSLIGALRNDSGEITAVHCIYLHAETAQKINIPPHAAKLSFGVMKGAALKLGNADGSFRRIAICEGIEDALSIMELTSWSCWATCSAGNFKNLDIPQSIAQVMIVADRDEAGIKAAQSLALRLQTQDRKVEISAPPEGCKDWNEFLIKEKASAATPANNQLR